MESQLAPKATVSAASDYYERARRELAEKDALEAAQWPLSVRLAVAGLAVPGALSLLVVLLLLFMAALSANEPKPGRLLVIVVMICVHVLLAAVNVLPAVLIYKRLPYARPLGYVAAVLNLCGGPLHEVCAVLCFIGLSTAEMKQYLSRR